MGRPPANGGPTFRFNPVEVGEMEAILQAHNNAVPSREILEALADRFSSSAERAGQVEISGKQVWNWFQNRRYALRARAARAHVPGQVIMPLVAQGDQATIKTVPSAPHPQAPQSQPSPSNNIQCMSATERSMPQLPHPLPVPSAAPNAGRNASENSQMEFEAKSARDGAWYDVASFLSHRSLETGDPEALVRFAGFGPEEDEWVNIRRHVRQRSLPCESSECVAILPGDLILCFQEGKEQALYFDAHVLDAQRRRHDVRGCRCRILVRYDHDQSEEIVPLRKICRRPETDYRMQQLHAESVNVNPHKSNIDSQVGNTLKVDAAGGTKQKQMTTTGIPSNASVAGESKLQPSNLKIDAAGGPTRMQMTNSTTHPNVSVASESTLQPSYLKVDAADGPTQMQTTVTMLANVSVTGEFKLQPSNLKVGAAGGTTQMQMTAATAPTNASVASESKLQLSNLKVYAAGGTTQMQMTTTTAPTNVSVASESKIQLSNLKVDAAGGTTQMQTTIATTPTNVSVAGESKLLPSKLFDAGNSTTVGDTNFSHADVVNTTAGGVSTTFGDMNFSHADVVNTTAGSVSNPTMQQEEVKTSCSDKVVV